MARAAVDVAVPGLRPARPEIPQCTVIEAAILVAAVNGRSRFDLMHEGLKGIDGGQLCRAIYRMERAGWLTRAMRRPSDGKRPQCFLTATPDGTQVLHEFIEFADSLTGRIERAASESVPKQARAAETDKNDAPGSTETHAEASDDAGHVRIRRLPGAHQS